MWLVWKYVRLANMILDGISAGKEVVLSGATCTTVVRLFGYVYSISHFGMVVIVINHRAVDSHILGELHYWSCAANTTIRGMGVEETLESCMW